MLKCSRCLPAGPSYAASVWATSAWWATGSTGLPAGRTALGQFVAVAPGRFDWAAGCSFPRCVGLQRVPVGRPLLCAWAGLSPLAVGPILVALAFFDLWSNFQFSL